MPRKSYLGPLRTVAWRCCCGADFLSPVYLSYRIRRGKAESMETFRKLCLECQAAEMRRYRKKWREYAAR